MAENLPKLMVMKDADLGGYASYTNNTEAQRGYVFCREMSVFSPWAKIAVERAEVDPNYVHLRFYHTNKYWAQSADNNQIAAVSNCKEEDTSKFSCTLFKPKVHAEDGLVYLTHVQSGMSVRTEEKTTRVCLEDALATRFSFFDVDTLVKLPKNLTFIGDNGQYMKVEWYRSQFDIYSGTYRLHLSGSDGNDEYVAYEAHPQPDGHLRLKSVNLDRFVRRTSDTPGWICGDDTSSDSTDSLFWPIRVDKKTIALRSAGNSMFCERSSEYETVDCLSASAPSITKEAKLIVEELVLERNIFNVRYRMEDARVYDSQPFVAGVGTAANGLDEEAEFTIKIAYEETRSYSFTNSVSLELGVKTTIEAGIPFVAEGEIEVSATATTGFEWGRTTEQKKSAEASYTVKVPPRTHVTVTYVGETGKCDVPFSYAQRDKSSFDGQLVSSQHVDGIFNGVDNYNFRFEQPKLTALPPI